MKFTFTLLLLLFFTLTATTAKRLPKWKDGELEIHHINTGRGESTFMVFPDGTTALLDAGDVKGDAKDFIRQEIDNPPIVTIVDYIQQAMPNGKESIDYLVASNFNPQQIGGLDGSEGHTYNRNPDYLMSGITAICEHLKFKKLIDRDYPLYNYPFQSSNVEARNYINFVRYQVKSKNMEAEHLDVGRSDQLALVHNKAKYNNYFRVFNLASNGNIWLGHNLDAIPFFALKHNRRYANNENCLGLAFRVNYGKFSYFTGADMSGLIANADSSINYMDKFVGKVCGKVNVCKLSNGASASSNSPDFLKAVNARDYIVSPWSKKHLNKMCMDEIVHKRSKQNPCTIFSTCLQDNQKDGQNPYVWGQYACQKEGHIVVKVARMGVSYKIYVLDNDMNIIAEYKR